MTTQSLLLLIMKKQYFYPLPLHGSQILDFYFKSCSSSSCDFSCVVLPLSSSFSSYRFLMNILIFYSASTLFFFQISTLCLYPFWKSLSLSNSSYNITFPLSPIVNLFFRLLETTWKQARNETFKVHEMEQSY